MRRTYYQILELTTVKSVTEEEIKRAYRRLSKKYHPDANPGNCQAEERFREISEAYAVLGDKEKRKKYDNSLKAAGNGERDKPRQERHKKGSSQGYSFKANPLDTTDLFEKYMGIRR